MFLLMARLSGRSRLQPMVEAGRKLKGRLKNILTHLRQRITNNASESINSKIQWVKYTTRGFHNKRNSQNAIYFHCGSLDPAQSSHEKHGEAFWRGKGPGSR